MKNYIEEEELVNKLKTGTPIERSSAARVLSVYTTPKTIQALITALDDPSHDVRGVAAYSLAELGRKDALADSIPRVVQKLIYLLEDKNLDVVGSAIYALGVIGNPDIGAILLPFLQYPDTEVKIREITIKSLCALRYDFAIPDFRKMLKDDDPVIRNAALLALFDLRQEFQIDLKSVLRSFQQDPSSLLQEQAEIMLRIIEEEFN